MKKLVFISISAISCLLLSCTKQNRINLAGEWQFTTDTTNWNQNIKLPGSMTSNGLGEDVNVQTEWTGGINDRSYFNDEFYAPYRDEGNIKIPFWLQPVKYYKGEAWYRKVVNIPENWEGQDIRLFLERCHWESRLWVDEQEIGMQNALGAPHQYDLTDILTAGRHTITLCIDNRVKEIDPGENAHSISDHTQGNWNGIVGDIYLQMRPLLNISSTEIYPDTEKNCIIVKAKLNNRTAESVLAELSLKVENNSLTKELELQTGQNNIELILPLKEDIRLWDEFHPNLYKLETGLRDIKNNTNDTHCETFGIRDFKVIDGRLSINGRPLFLRGALDCAAFPKTGYPPTDKESWMKIFRTCKSYGLNHIRFHSWCPPEAAFCAADEMGLYLEVECSSWATIGDGKAIDEFIKAESEAIVREYGNHPSFCMMMSGNEPAGWKSNEYLAAFVQNWKERDSRRIYSTSGGWPNLPVNDFLSDPNPRIQGWGQGLSSIINSQTPRTDYDWQEYTDRFTQPIVSHEIGQWCVYPNFKEISKYDGVMRPKNFEIFQKSLKDNGMEELADSFLIASGKLQALCYKADIEAALRTRDFGGFQLLGLSDFPGQGTALVGVLDAFWEEKGYISPEEYSRFCNSTVPLVRLPRLVYLNNEILEAAAEIAHYGETDINSVDAGWRLYDDEGNTVSSGKWDIERIEIGNCQALGKISVELSGIKAPESLVLEAYINGYKNSWNIWVYPARNSEAKEIIMADRLDRNALKALENGESVLLSLKKGSLSPDFGGDIPVGFSSIFWNTAWTIKQPPHTLGILCNPAHPALEAFPTEFHSDYQWWDAMSHSGAIEFSKLDTGLQPIVRVIDDWATNRPLALLLEARVGKGKLLISGIDFWHNMEKRPEARQMLYSLQKYMNSRDFEPRVELAPETVQQLSR